MAFARPPFDELLTRIRGDMRSKMQEAGKRPTLLRRTKFWVLAYVYAFIWHILYGELVWIAKQILPTTATDIDYLQDFGAIYKMGLEQATRSEGTVVFTGANGTAIPIDTEFVREDGFVYVVKASGTISGGTCTLYAQAELAGSAGNMDSDTPLTLSSPISGLDDDITIDAGFDAGVDVETIEPYRDRILERTSEPAHGGDLNDYAVWAKQVEGVFRVRVLGGEDAGGHGEGTVTVYFLHRAGTGPGIPTSPQIAAVLARINAKKPVTAKVYVMAPTPVELPITIDGLVPDESPKKIAVEASIDAFLASKALLEDTVYPNELYATIDGTAGVVSFDLDDPSAPVTVAVGEVLVLAAGTPGARVTWT